MLPEYFAIIGAIVTASGAVSYLIDTIRGRVKPNRVTWFLWALAPFVTLFAQLSQGVGAESLLTFVVGFTPAIIFLASFLHKDAKWHITKFDLICGALSLVGLILWYITRIGNVAIVLSIMADFLAAVPTLRKAYTNPETESFRAYFLNVIGAAITVLAVQRWNFENYAFSVYFLMVSTALSFFIWSKIGTKQK